MSTQPVKNASISRVKVIPAQKKTHRNEVNEDGRKRVIAAYARVSTLDEHQSSSYELQVSYYTDFIGKNPAWELYKVYTDEGVTGTSTKNRTGFLQMIEDAKTGKFEYIITKSISRFARNSLNCISTIRELKQLPNPVGVYFEKENIDTLDSKSELFLTILSSIAQEESRTISENLKWGIQKRFSQGKPHIPTTYFLGYDTDEDGNIVVNEDQAKIVRRIFEDFISGKGTPTIARDLMQDNVLTARGNPTWTSDSVRKLLRNEKYMGHALAQKTVTLDFLTHKRVPNNSHQPQYFIRNNHPAIITEEMWHETQTELKRRSELFRDPDRKYSNRYSGTSPFSNAIYCGECGRPVTRRRMTSTHKGKAYKYTVWHCRVASQRDKGFKDCKAQYVWETAIETAFMRLLYEMKMSKEKLIGEVKVNLLDYALTEGEEARLNELNEQVDKVGEQISDLAKRDMGSNGSIYEANMRHLIYEQEILQIERENLNKLMQDYHYMEKHLEELVNILDAVHDPEEEFKADYFKNTVESAVLYNEHRLELRFKCGINRTMYAHREQG